jgi:hypothetical protein
LFASIRKQLPKKHQKKRGANPGRDRAAEKIRSSFFAAARLAARHDFTVQFAAGASGGGVAAGSSFTIFAASFS